MWGGAGGARHRVADAIVAAVAAWAVERGYPVLGLGVTIDNARAIAFYRRLGFADTGQRWLLREGSKLEIQVMSRPLQRD
jgi:RimJ/RimL family protein N-acetyltransferase